MNWTEEQLAARNREVLGIDSVPVLAHVLGVALDADLMPEWMIEAECTKILECDGWRALRTDPVSDRAKGKGFGEIGMADHLYMRYADAERSRKLKRSEQYARSLVSLMWIEFKSAKGKPAKHQIEWHTKERARGALTLIAGVDFPANIEGFREWYRNSGLMRRREL